MNCTRVTALLLRLKLCYRDIHRYIHAPCNGKPCRLFALHHACNGTDGIVRIGNVPVITPIELNLREKCGKGNVRGITVLHDGYLSNAAHLHLIVAAPIGNLYFLRKDREAE